MSLEQDTASNDGEPSPAKGQAGHPLSQEDDDKVKKAQQILQSNPSGALEDPLVQQVIEHETLKYHLLGPSLTKAGQDSVDQKKVSEIIYNASKGSKFFNNEEVKDRVLTQKIERILARKKELDQIDLSSYRRRADDYIAELELSRDLSQYIVHIDCDAFYAAVEELDRPELKNVPFAVGRGVITTCNYEARKYGCRSGMAGFVAQKLCPQLIRLRQNFEKYTAKAQEVRAVLAEYDPRFESTSIDEAYLNITEYCSANDMNPEEVVSQLRGEVHERTKITVSAGIAANGKLAKIGSNKNKPNGQFRLANDRSTIMAFMRDMPTRKVNGVGRVFERELDAVGVKTCGDIYENREYIAPLFGQKAFEFLMTCYLGLGRTKIEPAAEHERKSVGTESTFHDLSGSDKLRDKLQWTAEELERDLRRTQFKGRTLTIKIKMYTYEVYTRQTIPPKAVYLAEDLYKYSEPMLAKLEKEFPNLTLRLMGLRCNNLVSTKKGSLDFFGSAKRGSFAGKETSSTISERQLTEDGWEIWPEDEFEAAARQEEEDEREAVEQLSQEHEQRQSTHGTSERSERRHGKELLANPKPTRQPTEPEVQEDLWSCPICGVPQSADDRAFNEHIDFCLSKQAIQETVKEIEPEPEAQKPKQADRRPVGAAKKRGRPTSHGPDNSNKKLFFA